MIPVISSGGAEASMACPECESQLCLVGNASVRCGLVTCLAFQSTTQLHVLYGHFLAVGSVVWVKVEREKSGQYLFP